MPEPLHDGVLIMRANETRRSDGSLGPPPTRSATLLAITLVVGCGSEPSSPTGALVEPGVGIGEVRLGMTYAALREAIGEADGALVNNRIGFARYPELGLEIVVTSPDDTLNDEAIVIGVGASEGAGVHGPATPGALRADVEAVLGPAPDVVEDIAYYPEGISVEYDGDRVLRVGVIGPYERRPEVPEMVEAGG